MNHFLSYILPCYNYADILEEALFSCYQQKNLKIPFEVICTDDNSPDENVGKILNKWKNTYDNFHVFHNPSGPGGECVVNNISVRNSRGDLFFCLDTDNVLVPDSVQGLVDLIDQTKCEGACFEELRFFRSVKGEKKSFDSWIFKAPNNIIDIRHITGTAGGMTPASSGNYMFTRTSYDKAGGYPEGNVMGSWSFGFKQHATGTRIAILPNTFYWHRYSEGGMYLTNAKLGLNEKAVFDIVSQYLYLFTEETVNFMRTNECQKNFLRCCEKGRIKLK